MTAVDKILRNVYSHENEVVATVRQIAWADENPKVVSADMFTGFAIVYRGKSRSKASRRAIIDCGTFNNRKDALLAARKAIKKARLYMEIAQEAADCRKPLYS